MSGSLAALFQRLTHGVYVVGVAHEDQRNAFTASWLMQASFDPLMLVFSINPGHSSYRILEQGKVFSVNVLNKDQIGLAAHYGAPASSDKLAVADWHPGHTGAPLLADALAWFECEVVRECPAGDHVLVLGRVIDGKLLDAQAAPMTYRDTADIDGAIALFPDTFSP